MIVIEGKQASEQSSVADSNTSPRYPASLCVRPMLTRFGVRSSVFCIPNPPAFAICAGTCFQELVYRLAYNDDVVAFKMGLQQGARRAHPAPLSIFLVLLVSPGLRKSGAGRNRRATRPPAHFQRNSVGRGQLAVFPRWSLGPYQFRYGRFARALKNSQLTCGDVTIICEAVH
jgi:hypothetical protein